MHVPLTTPKYFAIKASHFLSPNNEQLKQEIENTIHRPRALRVQ